jgi:hypothetical protein
VVIMPSPRGPELPLGMKELLDVIQRREDDDAAYRQQLRQLKMIMERDCEVHPARMLAILRQRIDQDLLFAEDFDLVRPRIREIIAEIWKGALLTMRLHVYQHTRAKIVDISVEIIRQLLDRIRGSYLEQRDGGRIED